MIGPVAPSKVPIATRPVDFRAAAEVEAGIVWLNAIITAFQRHRFGGAAGEAR